MTSTDQLELELLSLVDEASSKLSKRTLRLLAVDVVRKLSVMCVPRDGGIRFYEDETIRLNERFLSGKITPDEFKELAFTLRTECLEHATRIAHENEFPFFFCNHFIFMLDTSPNATAQQLRQETNLLTQYRVDELHKALERSRK